MTTESSPATNVEAFDALIDLMRAQADDCDARLDAMLAESSKRPELVLHQGGAV